MTTLYLRPEIQKFLRLRRPKLITLETKLDYQTIARLRDTDKKVHSTTLEAICKHMDKELAGE